MQKLGRRVLLVQTDVGDEAATVAAVDRIRTELGPITLLVNNAAYMKRQRPADITPRTWRAIFTINVEAVFHLMWLVREDMVAAGGGAIVNISSQAGSHPDPAMIAYGASKAALNSLTASAALAFAKEKIRVNAVSPGSSAPRAWTPSTRPPWHTCSARAHLLRQVPVGRMGEPEEIAATVAFLLSDAAAFVTVRSGRSRAVNDHRAWNGPWLPARARSRCHDQSIAEEVFNSMILSQSKPSSCRISSVC